MVSSFTLRRLAVDHAMLHSDLPPYYLLDPSCTNSSDDNLMQLVVFVTGPTGTPYSQGLWKLFLKIPDTYPAAPPTATFRTRIWHPNVEENTGSVCVDTLKKDWQPKLTLRDVLITIYCLMIHPNPDSALNPTAGHLLQDDYYSFAHQARLMTSIHARIPSDFKKDVLAAKRRGETAGIFVEEDAGHRPLIRGKSPTTSSDVVSGNQPKLITHEQSATRNLHQAMECQGSAGEDEDNTSASKEKCSLPSPCPAPASSLQRPSFTKRPLSDLVEPEDVAIEAPCLGPLDQTVVEPLRGIAASHSPGKGLQSPVRSMSANKIDCKLQATGPIGVDSANFGGRPAKRICSDSGKENILEDWGVGKLNEELSLAVSAVSESGISTSRKASSPSLRTSNTRGKPRVGLRRL